jgi:predicted aspartyl protease
MRILKLGWLILFVLIFDPCLPVLLAESQPEISFKLYDGFAIVIRGSIANEADLNLMVDTGAVPTAINQRLARKLKMTGSREDIAVVNERISVERVEVRNLRLGSLPDHRRVSAVVVDMSPIEARLGIHLDAIIGLDAIGDQDFAIDYHERRILFGAQAPNGHSVSFELRHQAGAPYLVVPAEIDSQPVSLLLDTGTDGLTVFTTNLTGRLAAFKRASIGQTVDARGAHSVQRFEIQTLRLGLREWDKITATAVGDAHRFAGLDFDGMLGPVSLGVRRIGFDFTNKTLFVEFKR